jgi:RhtB (resistance to homoserine/threonine) family protein
MWQELLLIAGIHQLAVMSPGPDFAMVMRNSLVYSRRTGVLAAVGLALGVMVHITYSLLGIGLIISRSIVLFNVIKWVGALYLIFIGIKSLFAKPATEKTEFKAEAKKDLTTAQAIRMGLLTNILNPKATLYFLALFTTVINPKTAVGFKMVYGLEMIIATFIWFSFVAIVLSHEKINRPFARIKHRVEQTFGGILIALGIKVALGGHK